MTHYGMVIDLTRCFGCNACVVACSQENGTPRDVNFLRVLLTESGDYPNVRRDFIPVQCNHCEDAPCIEACPTGASYREDDGRVLVDYDECVGCKSCVGACPYGNRFFVDEETSSGSYYDGEVTLFEEKLQEKNEWSGKEVSIKCDFCSSRLEEGLEPACVEACPAEARTFGDLDDPSDEVNRLILRKDGEQPLPDYDVNPSIFYVR